MDLDHPDLRDNLYRNMDEIPENGIDDDGNGYVDDVCGWNAVSGGNNPDDDDGHGTTIAGIIGAVGDNGFGVAGLSWDVQILPIKWSVGVTGSVDDVAACILYALAMDVDLMNCSFGRAVEASIIREAFAKVDSAGILAVCAAGNDRRDIDLETPFYPAGYEFPTIVSVAASDDLDELAYFSNWGAESVDLAAPGLRIFSSLPGGDFGLYDDIILGAHGSGTSFSVPFVVGALALMMERFPDLDHAALKARLLATVDPLPDLAGRMVSGGRLNAFLAVADPDDTPPAAIDDLVVDEVASNWAVLQWTATGDDGHTGMASSYEIRYATAPLTAASFPAATLLASPPDPLPEGALETVVVPGLAVDSPYYFAVKAYDEWGSYGVPGQVSPLSNVAMATTLGQPQIEVTVTELVAQVSQHGYRNEALIIANTGAGILDFRIEPWVGCHWIEASPDTGSVPAGLARKVGVIIRATGLACGEHSGGLIITGNDPGQPQLEIPVFITVVGPPDVALDPDGLQLEPMVVGSTVSGDVLVRNLGCEPLEVGGVLTDQSSFLVSDPGGFTLQPGEDRRLTISFRPLRLGTVSGRLGLVCNDPDEPAPSIPLTGSGVTPAAIELAPDTVSISLLTGSSGVRPLTLKNRGGYPLQFSLFTEPLVPWAVPVPASGSVAPGDSLTVQVRFRAFDFCNPYRSTQLMVASNDPVNGLLSLPTVLEVIPAADIDTEPFEIDFGEYPVGAPVPSIRYLTVTNSGCHPYDLNITELSTAHPVFTVDTRLFSLEPGESHEVPVGFLPTNGIDYFTRLSIRSDDPDEGLITVSLHGTGVGNGSDDQDQVHVPTADGPVLYNVPNPFNPRTEFRFFLPRAGRVEIRIFDLRGALVKKLDGGERAAGGGGLVWNGRDRVGAPVASGTYVYRLYLDGQTVADARRLTLLK
ncbi:MAG: S8 family serine peptidase [bacterium]